MIDVGNILLNGKTDKSETNDGKIIDSFTCFQCIKRIIIIKNKNKTSRVFFREPQARRIFNIIVRRLWESSKNRITIVWRTHTQLRSNYSIKHDLHEN